jgi:hypothetical protein
MDGALDAPYQPSSPLTGSRLMEEAELSAACGWLSGFLSGRNNRQTLRSGLRPAAARVCNVSLTVPFITFVEFIIQCSIRLHIEILFAWLS